MHKDSWPNCFRVVTPPLISELSMEYPISVHDEPLKLRKLNYTVLFKSIHLYLIPGIFIHILILECN